MKRKLSSILALLLIVVSGAWAQTKPQVPNGDFETWTYDGENLPNNWNSYSTSEGSYIQLGKGSVKRSTDVRPGSAGQYSCDIVSGSVMGSIVAVGNLTSGRVVLGATSASSSANYNYSDRDGSNTKNGVTNPCAMPFTGKPVAIKVWVKFTQATAQTTYKYAKFSAIIHSDADYKAYHDASQDNDDNKALVVASAVKADIESNGGEWQKLIIPFEYTENAVEPAYILINAYTNATPGKGSNGDHLYIDDIELVYEHSVSLATGTADADQWTISPSTTTEGETVTISYAGNKRVKSVKAVKKVATVAMLGMTGAMAQTADEVTVTKSTTNNNQWTFVMPASDVEIVVEYETELALNQNTDNSETLADWNGYEANVTLTRTLQAGGWNTFAVPFGIVVPTGWTVKYLESSNLEGGLLTLNFADAVWIMPGTPYLVKVDENVVNPTFEGVTISSYAGIVEKEYADFVPAVNPTEVAADESNLFVIGNTLTYPRENGTLNGFRAYFRLKNAANSARSFQMFFGDETTGIRTIGSTTTGNSAIYDIQGRRVANPTRGLYIVNGKKVVIK